MRLGLLYFLLISINGARVWSVADAVGNLAILVALGGGLAAGSLFIARKAKSALGAGDDTPSLGEGQSEIPIEQREAEQNLRSR